MFRNNIIRNLLVVLGLSIICPFALAQTPEEQAKANSDQILADIAKNKEEYLQDPSKLYAFVNKTIVPNVDMPHVSKLILGSAYAKATPEQLARFAKAFQTLMTRTYGNALLEFSGDQIEFLEPERAPEETDTIIRSRFLPRNGAAIPINYKVHLVDEKWLIYDIIVDNISLVTNYRGSFSSEIRKNGLDALINRLEARN